MQSQGFEADKLEFGSYDRENYGRFICRYASIHSASAESRCRKNIFTMHVYITALLDAVKYYHGNVIDIMGDGLMVFWGGKTAREKFKMFKQFAIQNAGMCGRDMLAVKESVINKIIEEEGLGPKVNIGIGVTFDSVIVTKIGIANSYDVKAFGDCINIASHYADETNNKVKVSKKVKNEWPSSKKGRIDLFPLEMEHIILIKHLLVA